MYEEGDLVEVTNLEQDIQDTLMGALGAAFEDISFYFVEYQDDDFVTLSAETSRSFAIIHCPIESIYSSYIAGEIDTICTQLLIDGALDRWNKSGEEWNMEMFRKLTSPPKESPLKEARIGPVFDGDDDF